MAWGRLAVQLISTTQVPHQAPHPATLMADPARTARSFMVWQHHKHRIPSVGVPLACFAALRAGALAESAALPAAAHCPALKAVVRDAGGLPRLVSSQGFLSLGRHEGNDVCVPRPEASLLHVGGCPAIEFTKNRDPGAGSWPCTACRAPAAPAWWTSAPARAPW